MGYQDLCREEVDAARQQPLAQRIEALMPVLSRLPSGELERDTSVVERDGVQFFHCGAVFAEVIDGCSGRREGELVEGGGAKALQEVDGADADADVRDVVLSAVLRNEDGDVVNQGWGDIGSLGAGDERAGGACGHLVGLDGIGQLLLKPEQFWRGPYQYVADTDGYVSHFCIADVVVLERRELEAGWIRGGDHLVSGCEDFGEVGGFDEALQHGDVRRVHAAQGEALGKMLEKCGIGCRGVLNHCGIRVEQDIDGCDVALSRGSRWLGGSGVH